MTTYYGTKGLFGWDGFERNPKKLVPKGFSLDKGFQNQEAAGFIDSRTSTGAGRDGLRISYGKTPYYKIESGPQAAPVPAAPAYTPPQRTQGVSSINFNKQLADIKAQNQASINALTSQLSDQKADYEAKEIAANKRISNLSSTVANAQSQYDPTKGMGSSNNINPALTVQEKNKSLSSGTQRYNRSMLSINNLNV
jgi:hypothetical protein